MELAIRKYKDIYIIDIRGDLDLYSAHKLKEVVAKMVERKIDKLVINMGEVGYLDSSGVGVLINVFSLYRENNFQLKIAKVDGSVAKVIQLTKLMDYFPIVEDLNTALSQLSN